ncbi:uncharacterized protein L969DRAFT_94541 [Mixia osmundae IAM 14324]|uniref:RING-type domain-containing protein n=1 Tax=Mixia osmundae (strain CBS 9802 / IAM 14324 / JCM 22182 / KY 12970) TaxID=764103 RepID=G7E0U1_MIXOS|nr:uncharacterized protein L969DRAFT_94541 [Mixia osmundae IAM 14324]KEI39480.1 hypothetical protein L969DRAFT_94541 [Mixia osmundae IAM 14324]GAA96451.1 hypothetical protein E5Q_03118 [Mixia osmundae IAM 14324]
MWPSTSDNPETFASFKQIYYRPKVMLLILTYLAFNASTTRQASALRSTVPATNGNDGLAMTSGTVTAPALYAAQQIAPTASHPSEKLRASPKQVMPRRRTSGSTIAAVDQPRSALPDIAVSLFSETSRSRTSSVAQPEDTSVSLYESWLEVLRSLPCAQPVWILFAVLHAMFLLEWACLEAEDELIKRSVTTTSEREHQKSRLAHLSKYWRANLRPILGMIAVITIAASVLAECTASSDTEVPFMRYLGPPTARLEHSGDFAALFRPIRFVVALEALTAMLALLQPLKHLLPHSIMPPFVSASLFTPSISRTDPLVLRERQRGFFAQLTRKREIALDDVEVESKYLVGQFVELVTVGTCAAQCTIIFFALHYHSPVSLATIPAFLYLMSMRGLAASVANIFRSTRRTVHCLRVVLAAFPLSQDGKQEPDKDWLCSICFEGCDWKQRRCKLHCSHSYHAQCLIQWLYRASTCPVCHQAVMPSRQQASESSAPAVPAERPPPLQPIQ